MIQCYNSISKEINNGNTTIDNDKEPGLNLLKLDGTISHLDHFDAFKFFKPSKSYSIGKNLWVGNQALVACIVIQIIINAVLVQILINRQKCNLCRTVNNCKSCWKKQLFSSSSA
jgi:hypothetical protein